jgi:hypothetical protein
MSIMDLDPWCVPGRVRVGIRRRAGRTERGMARGCEEQVPAGTDFQGWPGLMSIMDLDPWCVSGRVRVGIRPPRREEGAGAARGCEGQVLAGTDFQGLAGSNFEHGHGPAVRVGPCQGWESVAAPGGGSRGGAGVRRTGSRRH